MWRCMRLKNIQTCCVRAFYFILQGHQGPAAVGWGWLDGYLITLLISVFECTMEIFKRLCRHANINKYTWKLCRVFWIPTLFKSSLQTWDEMTVCSQIFMILSLNWTLTHERCGQKRWPYRIWTSFSRGSERRCQLSLTGEAGRSVTQPERQMLPKQRLHVCTEPAAYLLDDSYVTALRCQWHHLTLTHKKDS